MLVIDKKTGFKNLDGDILIQDTRGIIFYSTFKMSKKPKFFNLPMGKYIIKAGNFKRIENPIKFKLHKLPDFERNYKIPNDFKIIFGENPNKCSIIWDKKIIIFDYMYKNMPIPNVFYTLYHEYGHHAYKTEKYADLFAVNCMLITGFNPSQAGKSIINTLSDRQSHRKEYIINKILENE